MLCASHNRNWLLEILGSRRLRKERSGQALVEFAIVAPLIVMVLLFAIWFYELVHVKLKVQEAARYAAWEATAYPLHDYDKGPSELSNLASDMVQKVRADTTQRYMDMDGRDDTLSLSNRVFAASWTPPLVIMSNQQEEVIYGGPIVNLIFGIGAAIFDFISALTYKNFNMVAMTMITASKQGEQWGGGAMKYRMFGNSAWGFNRSGYFDTRVAVVVQNEWFNRGVQGKLLGGSGGMLMLNHYVTLIEKNGVLADPWHLPTGDRVYGNATRPGYSQNSPYWKQVDRIYMVSSSARNVAKGWITGFKAMMLAALAFTGSMSMPPNLSDEDFLRPSVVSGNYTDLDAGKVDIVQDRGSTRYDTAPVGPEQQTGGQGGQNKNDILGEYHKTLKTRGEHFMGCDKVMSLGCPSSTLQQDNPFGDYIFRGEGGGTTP
jgi:hypothetical protein